MRLNALDTLRYFGTLVLPILCKVLDIDSRRHDDGLLLPRLFVTTSSESCIVFGIWIMSGDKLDNAAESALSVESCPPPGCTIMNLTQQFGIVVSGIAMAGEHSC